MSYSDVVFTNSQPDTITAIKLNRLKEDLSAAIAAGGGGGTGTGDMTKAVYDTNNNGKVDTADSIPWTSVTGRPTTVGDMTKAVYDANNDGISDHATLADSATGNLKWQGTWGGSTLYALNDVVSYSDSTHPLTSYVCISPVTSAGAGTDYTYWGASVPSAAATGVTNNTYAHEFTFSLSGGSITKIAIYKGSGEASQTSHRIGVWNHSSGDAVVLDVTSSGEPTTVGWYWYTLATPISVSTSTHYLIGYQVHNEVVRNTGATFPITHAPITKVNSGFISGAWGAPSMGTSTSDLGIDVDFNVPGANPSPPTDPTHWSPISLSPHAATHLDNGIDPIPVVTTSRTGLVPILNGAATTYLDGTGVFSAPSSSAGPAVDPGAWTSLSLGTGWTALGQAQYRIETIGTVKTIYFRGMIQSAYSNLGTTAFTMPALLCPSMTRGFVLGGAQNTGTPSDVASYVSNVSITGACKIYSLTAGTTVWFDPAQTQQVYLDGMFYSVESFTDGQKAQMSYALIALSYGTGGFSMGLMEGQQSQIASYAVTTFSNATNVNMKSVNEIQMAQISSYAVTSLSYS